MNRPERSTNISNNNKKGYNIKWKLREALLWSKIYNKGKDWYYQDTPSSIIFGIRSVVWWIQRKINIWELGRVYTIIQDEINKKWTNINDDGIFFEIMISKKWIIKLENLLWYFVLIAKYDPENKQWLPILWSTYIKALDNTIKKMKDEKINMGKYIHKTERFNTYLDEIEKILPNSSKWDLVWIRKFIENHKEAKKPLKINTSKAMKLASWIAVVWWLTFAWSEFVSKVKWWTINNIETKTQHIVKKGETAYSIWRKYNITPNELKQINPEIKDISKLSIWQIVNTK